MTIIQGSLDTGEGLLIDSGLKEFQFLESPLGPVAKAFVRSGVHNSYKLPPMNIEGKLFIPVIYFRKGLITEIHLCPVGGGEMKWSVDSPKREVANKLDNDRWLTGAIGSQPPYLFPWGLIESVLDEKSGTSFVLLRFYRTETQ